MALPDKIYRSDYKPLTVPKSAAVNADMNRAYVAINGIIDEVTQDEANIALIQTGRYSIQRHQGLFIDYVLAGPTNAVYCTAKKLMVKSAGGEIVVLSNISASVAVGGLARSTWYALYVTWNGAAVGLVADANFFNFTPGGATHWARVGSIRTQAAGADLVPFVHMEGSGLFTSPGAFSVAMPGVAALPPNLTNWDDMDLDADSVVDLAGGVPPSAVAALVEIDAYGQGNAAGPSTILITARGYVEADLTGYAPTAQGVQNAVRLYVGNSGYAAGIGHIVLPIGQSWWYNANRYIYLQNYASAAPVALNTTARTLGWIEALPLWA